MTLPSNHSHGDTRTRLQSARVHLQHGRWRDAVVDLEHTVRANVGLAPAWSALATARYRIGDLAGSIDAARQAAVLDPADVGAVLQAGLGLLKLNRAREALQVFDLCAPQARAGHAAYQRHRGEAELALGLHREAVHSLLRAAALTPADPDIYQTLGYTLRAAGMHAEAAECFRTLVALKPHSIVGHAFVAHDDQHAVRWESLQPICSSCCGPSNVPMRWGCRSSPHPSCWWACRPRRSTC